MSKLDDVLHHFWCGFMWGMGFGGAFIVLRVLTSGVCT